jgi:hypothetical protein
MLFTTCMESMTLALASTAGKRHEIIKVPLLDVKAVLRTFRPWEDGFFFCKGRDDRHDRRLFSDFSRHCAFGRSSTGHIRYPSTSTNSWLLHLRLKFKLLTSTNPTPASRSKFSHSSIRKASLGNAHHHRHKGLAKVIVEAQEPPIRSPLSASLLSLVQSPIALQNAITQLQTC